MEKFKDYENYKKLSSLIPNKYTNKEKKELIKTALDLAYICLKYKKVN